MRRFVHEFAESFSRNQPLDLAAQLAYYAILAMFPFAMFLLTVAGYLPLHGFEQYLTGMAYRVMPPEVAKLTDATLNEIVGKQRGWLLWSSLAFALWTAASGTSGLITALNRAYDVSETRPVWRVKLRALLVTLAAIIGVIVATAAMLVGPEIARHVWSYVGLGLIFDVVWSVLRWPIAALTMMLMVACIYYFLPNVKQKWRFITPGSVISVLAWIGASLGFSYYVGHFSSYAKSYGALGTVVVLLVWLYISGLMVIVGGEINAILDRMAKGIVHTEEVQGPTTVPDAKPADARKDPPPPRGQLTPA